MIPFFKVSLFSLILAFSFSLIAPINFAYTSEKTASDFNTLQESAKERLQQEWEYNRPFGVRFDRTSCMLTDPTLLSKKEDLRLEYYNFISSLLKTWIFVNLQSLIPFNPQLVLDFLTVARKNMLNIYCNLPSYVAPASAGGLYSPNWVNFIFPSFHLIEESIYLAQIHEKTIVWFAQFQLLKSYNNSEELKNYWLRIIHNVSYLRTTIFHEMLHRLKLDNVPLSTHNMLIIQKPVSADEINKNSHAIVQMTQDAVYACANFASSYFDYFYFYSPKDRYNAYLSRIGLMKISCMTCAMANISLEEDKKDWSAQNRFSLLPKPLKDKLENRCDVISRNKYYGDYLNQIY